MVVRKLHPINTFPDIHLYSDGVMATLGEDLGEGLGEGVGECHSSRAFVHMASTSQSGLS